MPDRVFFACGACHILTYAFLDRHRHAGASALWLKPAPGHTGNHIVAAATDWIFDYHGYSKRPAYFDHVWRGARRRWPDWDATVKALPRSALISEAESKTHDGLWLREPRQFLHDALPRAYAFLDRFPPLPL